MPAIKDVIYSDFSIVFSRHPTTGNLSVVQNIDSVIQAIKTLIFTNYYERFKQPFLGSNLRHYLFEPCDSIVASHIRDEIIRLVSMDSRARLISCIVTAELSTVAGYNVMLEIAVNTQSEPVKISFFLEKIR